MHSGGSENNGARSPQKRAPVKAPSEMWRNRTVATLISGMTNGKALSISLTDGLEFNGLRKLAGDALQGQRSMNYAEIVAVRKKYNGVEDSDSPIAEDQRSRLNFGGKQSARG